MALDIDELISEGHQAAFRHKDDQRHEDTGPGNMDDTRESARVKGDGNTNDDSEGDGEKHQEKQKNEDDGIGALVDNGGFTMDEVCVALGKGNMMEIDWNYCEKISTSFSNGVWDCGNTAR